MCVLFVASSCPALCSCRSPQVVTGVGKHSDGGIARLRPAVYEFLLYQQLAHTEPRPGHFQVTL